ncbi:MAG: hypothetical protein CM15mP129_01290 [Chloroflexota bacterium]|nr:MAG: hypothetical protein CM15mP129_01290 [Chloroflexota bacterium]
MGGENKIPDYQMKKVLEVLKKFKKKGTFAFLNLIFNLLVHIFNY